MSIQLTGSVDLFGSVSSSLFGTASWAENTLSASYAVSASYAPSTPSVSASYAETASYALMAETASYAIVSVQSITSSITRDVEFRAINNGTDIPAGTPVYISSSDGNHIIVEIAQALDQTQTVDIRSEIAGVTRTAINGSDTGSVVAYGQLIGIDMSAFSSGDKIWVSKTIGQLTNVAPEAPYDRTFVGIVTKDTANGRLFVDMSQPIHFHDISSVSSSIYNNGDLWVYQASASTGIWTNKKTLSGSYEITGSLFLNGVAVTTGGGGGGAVGNLQSVTTAGNQTSASVNITGSLTNGLGLLAKGTNSHAQGFFTVASGSHSHAEGDSTVAIGGYSHAEGYRTTTIGVSSHAEGTGSVTIGAVSHAEGNITTAIGNWSHAEGFATVTNGSYQHAQGQFNAIRTEQSAVIIGDGTSNAARANLFVALPTLQKIEVSGSMDLSGPLSINGVAVTAGGGGGGSVGTLQAVTTAGNLTTQSIEIEASLVQGLSNSALGAYSHAQGNGTQAIGDYSHTEGIGTIADGLYQHAQGQYNLEVSEQSSFVIGKGSDDSNRANILEVLPISNVTNISSSLNLPQILLYDFVDDVAAEAGGVAFGGVYHSGGILKIRSSNP